MTGVSDRLLRSGPAPPRFPVSEGPDPVVVFPGPAVAERRTPLPAAERTARPLGGDGRARTVGGGSRRDRQGAVDGPDVRRPP